MAEHLSPDQVRSEHERLLGPELGAVYHHLWNECAWLHLKWDQFLILYGSSEQRIDLLNESASLFFRVVQDSLWEHLLIHVCALTDPAKTGAKENLTVRRLSSLITDPDARAAVERVVTDAVSATEFARDWRNRHIAHRDLALALSDGAEPLASASRSHLREAIQAISEVVRQVSLTCMDQDIAFGRFGEPGDATALLYVLRDGVRAERSKRERFTSGTPLPGDLNPPEPI